MKLWRISQNCNSGYDTYDSAIVAAESEEDARNTHPSGHEPTFPADSYGTWALSPDQVSVEYIGDAAADVTPGTVCASFNAG